MLPSYNSTYAYHLFRLLSQTLALPRKVSPGFPCDLCYCTLGQGTPHSFFLLPAHHITFPLFIIITQHMSSKSFSPNPSSTLSSLSPVSIYVDTLHRISILMYVLSSGYMRVNHPFFSSPDGDRKADRMNRKNRTVQECTLHTFPRSEDQTCRSYRMFSIVASSVPFARYLDSTGNITQFGFLFLSSTYTTAT